QLTHTLVIATNHRPRVFTSEHAVWRRLRLIPFPHRYAGPGDDPRPGDRPRDGGLRSRITRGSAQRAALLAWIVAGAGHWYTHRARGARVEIGEATAMWRTSADTLLAFMVDQLAPAVDEHLRASDLYDRYREWATSEGARPLSNRRFGEAFALHPAVVAH